MWHSVDLLSSRVLRHARGVLCVFLFRTGKSQSGALDVDSIPIATLDVDIPISVDSSFSSLIPKQKKKKKYSKKEKKKRRKKGLPVSDTSDEDDGPTFEVAAIEEMPEGARLSDEEDEVNFVSGSW